MFVALHFAALRNKDLPTPGPRLAPGPRVGVVVLILTSWIALDYRLQKPGLRDLEAARVKRRSSARIK
jgi:hypothetical protein